MNIAFITGASLLGRVLNMALHAGLGRMFGPEGLGGYSTAIAISSYFMLMSDLGLSPRFVREGAVNPERLDEEYANALGFKMGTALLASTILGVVLLTLPYDRDVLVLIGLLGIASILRSFSYLNEAVCRARERLDVEGAIGVLNAVLFVGISLGLLSMGHSVEAVGWASLGTACIQLAFSFWMAGRFVRLSVSVPDWSVLGRAILPYATTSLTLLAFAQIDILIVSLMKSQSFVGEYASISRILLIVGTLGALASAAVLPTVARLFGRTPEAKFNALVFEALRFALLLGSIASLGLVFIAKYVVGGIYGTEFQHLYPLVQFGAIYLVFKFSVAVLATILTSIGRQSDRARSVIFSLIATVFLVVLLTESFGLRGTVGALVGSECVLAICCAWYLRARFHWGRLVRTLVLAGVGSAGTFALWANIDWGEAPLAQLGSIAIPISVYIFWIFLTGEGASLVRFVLRTARTGGS